MSGMIYTSGEHAEAVSEGRAVYLAVLVYYPNEDKLVTVGMDTVSKEETAAILAKFMPEVNRVGQN